MRLPLKVEGVVEVHGPVLCLDGGGGGLLLSPFCHEFGEDLGLNHDARGVGDVEAHELEPPLGDAAGGLPIVDNGPKPLEDTTTMGWPSK